MDGCSVCILSIHIYLIILFRSNELTDDEVHEKDDPHDDITDRLGNLPKENTNSTKRTDKRDPGWSKQSNVQRKKPPVAKRGEA